MASGARRRSSVPSDSLRRSGIDPELPAPPSIDLLIRVATSIIEPSVVWPEIDALIQILSQIELYRLEIVEQARILARAKRHFRPSLPYNAKELENDSDGDEDEGGRNVSVEWEAESLKADVFEVKMRAALEESRHDRLRGKFLQMIFIIKWRAIRRRYRIGLSYEAREAYDLYWPNTEKLERIARTQPSPFTLLITSMSPSERDEYETEAEGVLKKMDMIEVWGKERSWVYPKETFDEVFLASSKEWVNVVKAWMNSVRKVVQEISSAAQ